MPHTPFSEFTIGNIPTNNLPTDYEANLFKALNDFNEDYFTYIGNCYPCKGDTINGICNATVYTDNGEVKKCNDALSQLRRETDHITTYVNYGIRNNSSIFSQYGNVQALDNFNSVRGNIVGNIYPNLLQTRANLDMKLRDLYEIDGSISLDQQNKFDGTIYSGVLLTILASALVYYTFTKL
jgi:hypothetical protein